MSSSRERTLNEHFATHGTEDLRPIMTSLNHDNSWLLSFPRPKSELEPTGKFYYHVIFEPWLNGPTGLWRPWVVDIQHVRAPAIRTAEGVYALAREIEAVARKVLGLGDDSSKRNDRATAREDETRADVDAILLGFHYDDHVHRKTLELFDKSIPVIATPEATNVIKPWNHFTTIRTISNYTHPAKSWRDESFHPGEPFPSWLSVMRLPGHHELNYITAIIWTHTPTNGTEIHETIMQSPHGTRLEEGPLQSFLDSSPPTQKLALLHGLKENDVLVFVWKPALGASAGLALYRRIGGARYWVQTHDAPLWYSGIFMWLVWVRDTFRTIQWALEVEEKSVGKDADKLVGGTPNVVDVEGGKSFVLA